MALIDEINRIKRIDRLIRLKATGNAQELSEKLQISRKMTYNYLNHMKDMGAPIHYCRKIKSFYYLTDGKFEIEFKEFE